MLESSRKHVALQAGALRGLGKLVVGIGQQREQQVLGARELIASLLRIGEGVIERAFRARSDVNSIGLRGNWAAAQLGAQPFEQERGLEVVEYLKGGLNETVRLAEQANQQMLGIELVVAEAEQELLDAGQRLTRFFGETFERNQDNPPGRPG